ncbi:BRO-N domain-containing protein [Anaerosinus sp.]
MNELQIFSNKQFGEIRTIEIEAKIYFVASDVARALGYKNTRDAILKHCKGVVKRDIPTNGGKQLMNVIPEGDLYRLVTHSELPSAEKFESWIFDEVLPTIRKTGTYSIKQESASKENTQLTRAKAMLLNAKTRAAQTWLKIAEAVNIPEYKQIASTYAANTLADKQVLELPIAERKTYSATDIAKQFNITKNMIGKIANEHNLKTTEYGKLFYDKSPYSSKQVETWRYYENAIPAFAKILGVEVIGL